jgi:hypothetical protein
MEPQTAGIALSLISIFVAFGTGLFVIAGVWQGLRAKHKAVYLLREEARKDAYLRMILTEASSPAELNEAQRQKIVELIEKKIVSLPEPYRGRIEEGLNQENRVAVKRFLRELSA